MPPMVQTYGSDTLSAGVTFFSSSHAKTAIFIAKDHGGGGKGILKHFLHVEISASCYQYHLTKESVISLLC